jgi:hypothetical protein
MTTTFFGNPDLYYVFPGYWDDDYDTFDSIFSPGEYSGSPLTGSLGTWIAVGTFFGNSNLYYVFPGYWDNGYEFNPDFTPGEYSGTALSAVAAQWDSFGFYEAFYSGSTLVTAAGAWSSSGTSIALYTGSILSTSAADRSATGDGVALYSGSTLASVAATWEAGEGQEASYTGSVLTIGSFTILPPAGWNASGGAVAFYTGVALATVVGSFSADGGAVAAYLGFSLETTPGAWSAQGTADAAYTGSTAGSDAANWEAGVTAFYSGTDDPLPEGFIDEDHYYALPEYWREVYVFNPNAAPPTEVSLPLETTSAQWGATGGAAGGYRGGLAITLAGLWSTLAVGDPLGPPERRPLPARITDRGYGSSDIAAPSFNRTQYVKHGSIHEPLDLGLLGDVDVFIDGAAGGEHGSHTIFYSFRTDQPLRVGARILPPGERSATRQQPGEQWDQTNLYISVSVTDASQRRLESGDKVFLPESNLPAARFGSRRIELGYADSSYWKSGYSNDDDLYQEVTGPINYVTNFGELAAGADFAPAFTTFTVFYVDSGYWEDDYTVSTASVIVEPIIELLPDVRAALRSAVQPAGTFTLAVSNSQWTEIPYTLQIALRLRRDLRGIAGLRLDAKGRIPVSDASGTAELRLLPAGFIPRNKVLIGEALLQLKPRAALWRTSPFD